MNFHNIIHHDDERVVEWCHQQDIPGVPENHGLTWTTDQDNHLIRCYKKGWPVLAIARFLKRGCYAVVCRLWHHGYDWRKVLFEYKHTPLNIGPTIAELRGMSTDFIVIDEASSFKVADWQKVYDHVKSNFPFHPKEKVMKENISGRFWMIQNGDIKAVDGIHCKDKFGRSMVSWPGRSIFPTKAEAVLAAKDMAAQFPDSKFYVMEAVSVHETTKPPVKSTTFKSR